MPTTFAGILSAVGLLFIFTLQSLFSKVQEGALNPCIQNVLENAPIIVFLHQLKERKFFTRKVWTFCTPSSSILGPPKHLLVFFLSILSPEGRPEEVYLLSLEAVLLLVSSIMSCVHVKDLTAICDWTKKTWSQNFILGISFGKSE